jgi:hypothetical protein
MSTKLAKIVADFQTSLATKIDVGGTSFTLQGATDDDGVALASGRYLITVDTENSSKEHYSCDVSGVSVTNLKSISRQGAETSGSVRAHRVGASVTMTNFAHLLYIVNLLNGTTDLDASTPLKYDGTASISNANHLATKAYVDGVAVSGAPDASTTTKGIVEEATQAELDAGTAVGGTSARLFANPSTLRATKYHNAVTSTGSSNAYVVDVTPNATAYSAGQIFGFIANFANTGACTINVDALGAKTIKKNAGGSDLEANDIKSGQFVLVGYDGTNMHLLSIKGQEFPADVQTFTSSGTWTKPSNAKTVEVYLFGAGGGGAGGSTSISSQPSPAGNGGGGGAFTKKTYLASYLASTVSVTIGAGGAGSTQSGADVYPVPTGASGGNTSFGSHLVANGGGGGEGAVSRTTGGTSAGAGGTATNGDFSFAGGAGAVVTGVNTVGGNAASTGSTLSPRGGGSGAWYNGSGSVAGGSGGGFTGTPTIAGGAGSTTAGAAGTASGDTSLIGGTGGGGGGQSAVSGGAGGAGGFPGGGGGGGGGNYGGGGTPSTFKGGNGAGGLAVIITHF